MFFTFPPTNGMLYSSRIRSDVSDCVTATLHFADAFFRIASMSSSASPLVSSLAAMPHAASRTATAVPEVQERNQS